MQDKKKGVEALSQAQRIPVRNDNIRLHTNKL